MRSRLATNLISLLLASSTLLGCVQPNDSIKEDGEGNIAVEPPACADCELKELIAAKKGQIAEKKVLLAADKASIKALKDYNDTLKAAIKDYDKKIDTLKNSKMQFFKFALEGALAVLEVESLVGLAKNVKCLKPTSKVPIVVNGVTVAGPKILKFGLALKDPGKMKMFVAKATIKGSLAATTGEEGWVDVAVGFIPLTSAMKLPQRWNEWINASELIAVIEDAKVKVEEDIATNEASIKTLENVVPKTEKRIAQLEAEVKALEEELAKGGQCSVDDAPVADEPVIDVTPVTALPVGMKTPAGTPSTWGPSTTSTPTPTLSPPGSTPGASCGDGAGADYIDYADTSVGADDCGGGTGTTPPTMPPTSGDITTFPWGQKF